MDNNSVFKMAADNLDLRLFKLQLICPRSIEV